MSNLVRSSWLGLEQARGPQVGNRVPKAVVRQIDREAGQGLIVAGRVQAAAYVTHVALQQVALLSGEEGRLMQICPLAEPRLKILVDNFTGVAAAEIAGMGW